MFEFKKVCDTYEKMSAIERGLLLTEKSAVVFAKLHDLFIPGVNPVDILAGFIIGSVTADGRINEKEYLLIYPALIKTFGDDFDFASIKESFRRDKDGKKLIADYTEEMLNILSLLDEELKWDVITLCLCVTSIDGKITLKEKRYIRCLCEAGTKS